jgi:mannosyltransferase
MAQDRRSIGSSAAMVAGVLLCAAAAVISNVGIERALGQREGSLSWGPLLFRTVLAVHGVLLLIYGTRSRTVHSKLQAGRGTGDNKPWIVLLILSVVALALRLWHLNSCLWYDEVITLLDFVRPSLGAILTSFNSQNQHMLFSVLAHISVRAFGESAWAVRLPSVVFGVGSLWALFLLGRRLLGSLEALLACALMTVSYHHIWFSQNARGYMGLMFFATLATWVWLEAIECKRVAWWVAYSVTVALGLWVHLTMLFVLAAHGVVHAITFLQSFRSRADDGASFRSILQPAGAWLLCGSLTLQLYALSLPDFFRNAIHEGVAIKSDWTNPLWVLRESLHGLKVGWSGAAVVFCGGVLALAGYISIFRRDWRPALAMVLPAILGAGTMFVLSHPFWPRFFFFMMGFALLIVIEGAMITARVLAVMLARGRWEPLALRLGVAVSVLMIGASILTLPRYYAIPKQDFITARDYVEQNRKPGDSVVAVGLAGTAYSRYFAPSWLDAQTRTDLDNIRHQHSNLWLVYTIPAQLHSLDPEFLREVESDFKVVRVFRGTLGGGDILVCAPRAAQLPVSPPLAQASVAGSSHP